MNDNDLRVLAARLLKHYVTEDETVAKIVETAKVDRGEPKVVPIVTAEERALLNLLGGPMAEALEAKHISLASQGCGCGCGCGCGDGDDGGDDDGDDDGDDAAAAEGYGEAGAAAAAAAGLGSEADTSAAGQGYGEAGAAAAAAAGFGADAASTADSNADSTSNADDADAAAPGAANAGFTGGLSGLGAAAAGWAAGANDSNDPSNQDDNAPDTNDPNFDWSAYLGIPSVTVSGPGNTGQGEEGEGQTGGPGAGQGTATGTASDTGQTGANAGGPGAPGGTSDTSTGGSTGGITDAVANFFSQLSPFSSAQAATFNSPANSSTAALLDSARDAASKGEFESFMSQYGPQFNAAPELNSYFGELVNTNDKAVAAQQENAAQQVATTPSLSPVTTASLANPEQAAAMIAAANPSSSPSFAQAQGPAAPSQVASAPSPQAPAAPAAPAQGPVASSSTSITSSPSIANVIQDYVSDKVSSALNNPAATIANIAASAIPGVGLVNTASGLLGGPTIGGSLFGGLAGQGPTQDGLPTGEYADLEAGGGSGGSVLPLPVQLALASGAGSITPTTTTPPTTTLSKSERDFLGLPSDFFDYGSKGERSFYAGAAEGGYFDADAYFADGGLVSPPKPPIQPVVSSMPTMAYTDGQGPVGAIAAPPALSGYQSFGSDAPHASPMAPAPAAAAPSLEAGPLTLATHNVNAAPVSAPISQNPNLGYSLGMSPLSRLKG